MRSLEEPAPEREVKLSRSRLVVLTIASLIAPATQVLVGGAQGIDMRVMIASSSSLFLLVVARMAVLVRQQERSVERERALRAAGLALVAASARDQIAAAALGAARTLAGPGFAVRLYLLTDERLELIDEYGRSEQRSLSPATTQRTPHPRSNMDQPTRGDAPDRRSVLNHRCLTPPDTHRHRS